LRGELPVSGAVKIPLGEDLRAVWSEAKKKMTTPAVFPESPSSTGSSGARSTNQNLIAL
jgi:hypothetical protein